MSATACGLPRLSRLGRAACALLLFLAAAMASGCEIFPRGTYWAAHEGHLAPPREVQPAAGGERPAAAAPGTDPAALRARIDKAIAQRWSDDALAASAREMDAAAGRWVYADAMRVIVSCYVDPITYRDVVVAGLRSLRAALDHPDFRRRFPEAQDARNRARFAEALEILRLKAGAADPWFASQAGEWLAVAMEKNRTMLGLPDGAIVAEFLFGAIDTLDPYTYFLTSEMRRGYEDELEGAYTGIGAEILSRQGRFFLGQVFEGAAAKAGLARGDELVAIDGRTLTGLALVDVRRLLRGKAGDKVTLAVRKGGEGQRREVVLVRSMVHLPFVRDARILEAAEGIGYLRLTGFKSGTEKELRLAIRGLAGQGAKALILDLRDNPGGSLFDAVGVVGALVEKGRVLRTRGRMLGATWSYDVPLLARPEWRGPLAVLTSPNTASASEVVAAALARHHRATVIGQRTYGKGAVQILLPVGRKSAVCVTIARVYDPDGVCLEGEGVAPDRRVDPPARPAVAPAEDPVVRAAVEAMRAALARPSSGARRADISRF